MAIAYRSTPKRKPAKNRADVILTREDFEDAVSAINITLADLAKQTGINRQYLSEFKCGDRNLRPEHLKKLRDFFESQGVEFFEIEADDEADFEVEGEDAATDRRPRKPAAYATQVFPLPTIVAQVDVALTPEEREAAQRQLDAIVRENDRQLAMDVDSVALCMFGCDDITKELRRGLTLEAVLRRVLDGSFAARWQKAEPKTQAELIARQYLGGLSADPEQPTPAASSEDAESLAANASAMAAGETGAKKPSTFLELYGS
jgi:transcriptional regulator with XRE-family HTH domain